MAEIFGNNVSGLNDLQEPQAGNPNASNNNFSLDSLNNTLGSISTGLGSVSDLVGNINTIANQWNNIGQPTPHDQLGNIDVAAPGTSTTTGSNPFYDITGQYTPGIAATAEDIYNQGPANLNPLQTAAYNQVSPTATTQTNLANQGADLIGNILSGNDAYTNQLAQQAATAAGAPFGSRGTFGGARHARAANTAAADAILKNQLLAQGRIGTVQQDLARPIDLQDAYGQDYYDWQTNQPWDHLSKFQDAIGYGQHVPSNQSTTKGLSGADIWNKTLAKNVYENHGIEGLRALAGGNASTGSGGTIGGSPTGLTTSYQGPLGQVQQGVDTLANTVNTVGNIAKTGGELWDLGTDIWDTASNWIETGWDWLRKAEGGKITREELNNNKHKDWF